MSETKVTQPTATEERKWKELGSAAAEEWGGSPEEMESLFEYRLNDEVTHQLAADEIENAYKFLQEKENSISAVQQVRLSEEVEPAMCQFSDLIDALFSQGLSLAAVYSAMHNELGLLSEEITDPAEDAHARWRGAKATKAPLFPGDTTERTASTRPRKSIRKTAEAAKA
jgi:hypothetical protein